MSIYKSNMEEEYTFLKEQINQLLYDFPHYITEPEFEIKLFNYIKIISMDFIHEQRLNYLYQQITKNIERIRFRKNNTF